jgi:hypothetical protein
LKSSIPLAIAFFFLDKKETKKSSPPDRTGRAPEKKLKFSLVSYSEKA